ncbi:XRE family transcriptional regulator [Amycolatopsis sp. lyj-108]|uniref:XRE family transcriptional regulator n=1 Tax=Amycolatopsis sp. lyj-108 TaxID=2789286 RepID=UPI00397B9152
MGATIYEQGPPDPQVWEGPRMRAALAARDIAAVFRLLKACGVSQRRIASLTGQSQPEVSDIVRGRVVMAYEVLSRIATGLQIPRGYMGLAYAPGADPARGQWLAPGRGGASSWLGTGGVGGEGGSEVERRAFIALAAQAALVGLSASEWDRIRIRSTSPAAVGQLGAADAVALENSVVFYRAQDDALGGGAVRSAVTGHLNWAVSLLDAPTATDQVRARVVTALADLHSVAGWASFDAGDHDTAKHHFANGLVLAKEAGRPDLAAKVLFQAGRVLLHDQDPNGALKIFQLGQASADDAHSPRAAALLTLNAGWAYAELAMPKQAAEMLARAGDTLAREQDPAQSPSWLAFMGPAEIDGITGMTFNALASHDRAHAEQALEYATRSREARPESDTRSRTSDLVAVAANTLRAGDPAAGLAAAREALPAVAGLHSQRLTDRLAWISQAAALYPKSADARQLVADITTARRDHHQAT